MLQVERKRKESEGGRGEERERDEREGEMKGVKEEDLKEAAKTQKIL